MLAHLTIRDLAIVDRLELELGPGMTALTGETGAGKSILVDALGLGLGARASADAIRPGCDRAEVSALFELSPDGAANRLLRDMELDEPGAELLARRIVAADGRSRAFVNARPVTVQTLRTIGALVADIHGQHAHQSLLRRDSQRAALDDFAGHAELVGAVREAYRRWREKEARLEEDVARGADAGARLDYLRYQLEELDRLGVEADAITGLEEEHRRLAHVHELVRDCARALEILEGDAGASAIEGLEAASRTLGEAREHDPALGEFVSLIETATIETREAVAGLRRHAEGLEADPDRLAMLERRLADLQEAARKHRVTTRELPALRDRLRREAAAIEDASERLARLEAEREAALEAWREKAARLRASREDAAGRFAAAIEKNMRELGMSGARFEVGLEPDAGARPSPAGGEQVEFRVSANPGQPPQPLARIASGGELARISLAIQVILTGASGVPVLVFDEVDVGVGGRLGAVIGRRLRDIGARRQVLCITHLPQVASLADRHVHVHKQPGRASTRTTLASLDGERRVEEIARMLGGTRLTDRTIAHAREMLGQG